MSPFSFSVCLVVTYSFLIDLELTLCILAPSDLEQAVEALSEMIEKPLEDDKFEEIRQQTTDKTVYVAQRCRILLQDTLSGYDEVRFNLLFPSHLSYT